MNDVKQIEDSPTVTIHSMVQEKRAAGIKIYNLSAGEPYLPVHELLLQAGIEALRQKKILYPPVSGLPELKCLATEWMNTSYGCSYQQTNCLVVNGGKFGIYLLLQLMLNKTDKVIIASPYWVSYPAITKLFGGIPYIIETQEAQGWKITPYSLKQACLISQAKILIINNATNPTGSLYTRAELSVILGIAKQYNVLVISDEVYSYLTYDHHDFVSCGSFIDHQDHVLVIQSCSKNFAMTGWRVGFVFGNATIIKALTSLISQSTSGVATLNQWVAVAALKNAETISTWVRLKMTERRNTMLDKLNKFNVKFNVPISGLYFFIPLQKIGINSITSTDFCIHALEKINTALVPGIAFGTENYIRLSFGASLEDIIQGVSKLAQL